MAVFSVRRTNISLDRKSLVSINVVHFEIIDAVFWEGCEFCTKFGARNFSSYYFKVCERSSYLILEKQILSGSLKFGLLLICVKSLNCLICITNRDNYVIF